MMTDPIADMLTRIRNAQMVRHRTVQFPGSRLKEEICRVLKEEGYIADYEVVREGPKSTIRVYLKYYQGRPVIEHLKRVSKPGRRVFVGRDQLPKVWGGMGIAIISTPRGIMTDKQARREGHGGEVICTVA